MNMRDKFAGFLCSLIACLPLQVHGLSNPTEPEILFAKRIVELWGDRDTEIVINQSYKFFRQYPDSVFKDALLGIVAESYRERHNYPKALKALNGIQSDEYKRNTLITRIDTLQKMNRDQQIIQELHDKIPSISTIPSDQETQIYVLCYADTLRNLANKTKKIDQKKEYLSVASRRYRTLKETSFSRQAYVGLASVYSAQGKEREGAKVYIKLAEEYPENQDAYFYQAAILQMAYDPEEAFTTLEQASQYSQQNQSDRSILKAKLLYDLGEYQRLIQIKESLKQIVHHDHQHVISYYLGMSYFQVQNYAQASENLGELVKNSFTKISSTDTQKNILLHLITAEYQLCNPQKAHKYSTLYKKRFSDNEGVVHIHLVKGTYLLKTDKAQRALKIFEQTIKDHPEAKEINHIKHQKNLALMKLEQWDTARSLFINFAKNNPKDPLGLDALKNVPLCTQYLINQAKKRETPTDSLNNQLIDDLQLMMNTKGVLTAEQKPSVLIEQIRTYNTLKDYRTAYKLSKLFLEKHAEHPDLYQVHILIAQAMDEMGGNKKSCINHLKEALALNHHIPQAPSLHIKLFKIYIDIMKEKKDPYFLDQACDHLYTAYSLSSESVPQDNRSWLATAYTQKLEKRPIGCTYTHLIAEDDLSTAKKAVKLYQSIDSNGCAEKTNLAKCYLWLDDQTHAMELIGLIETDASTTPQDKNICHFLKAQVLNATGNSLAALEQYKGVTSGSHSPPIIGLSASLNTARLTIDTQKEDSLTIDKAFKQLKNLQMQKQLKTEPVHLEAALDYCFLQSNQAPTKERQKKLLEHLKKMKSDFTNTDDIASQDYHAAKQQYPEKEALYQHYMLLVDGYIHLIEAKHCSSYRDRKIKNEVANNLLNTITSDKKGLTLYLQDHVNQAIEMLNTK